METHYYLSSLPADAPRLAAHIREHWAVESFHHVRDMTFGEDHCQVRECTAAHNLCLLRKRAALDPAFRADLLASISPHFGA